MEEYPQGPVTNTKVVFFFLLLSFLPANATAVSQRLDQGILKAWKTNNRKKNGYVFLSSYAGGVW